ncbi:MAG: tetratricopeptide repeat protein [Balneolaceae bacterium]|nr:tetratricopeptide repeat protein [Balneolaceae bacterium]
MAKRRLTKEELEQDPLIDTYNRVQSYYEQHQNAIISAAIAVIVFIGGSIGYYYYSQSQERSAQQLMGYAETYFLQADYQRALTGSEEDFTVGFEQIINNYSGTDAANLARYYAAICEFNLGDTELALSYMEEYEVPEGIMGVAPLSFHAVLYTELGQHRQAAEIYVRAAEWDQNDSTTPYNYLEAANAYLDAGDTDRARELANRIIDEYPNSAQISRARRLLGLASAG